MKTVVFPPSPEDMSKLVLAGYHDAVAFLGRYGMIQTYSCSTCLTVKTTLSPKDVLKVSFDQWSLSTLFLYDINEQKIVRASSVHFSI